MKRQLTLFLVLVAAVLHAQTIYVKYNATGANTGASWADAFTSLDQALATATAGQQIWVAAGTYKPANAAPNNFFLVVDAVKLYGGFAGTETSLNQRNIAANATILSGDLAGNDVAGDFVQNRTDNTQHVVVAGTFTNNDGIVIDGFTISHGQTLEGSANPDLSRRGGGLLINARATVRNCRFTENFGDSGAALAALDALSDGIVVENCLFENNKASQSGIFFLRSTPTGIIKKNIFRNNNTNRGALYPSETTDLKIDSCLFESNNAGANFAAAMFTWQATYELTNCIFRKNKAANAAGIYIDNRDGGDVVTIDHCLFELDSTTSFGGSGIYGWQATFDLTNTIFRNNYGPNGTAIYCNGREFDSSFNIENCAFEGNVSTAAGAAMYQNRTNYQMKNCSFKNNVSGSSGALAQRDTTIFTITDCLFEGNKGNYAAAVANYGIGCNGDFVNCTFNNNQATQGGGACSNGFKADVAFRGCLFTANKATFGGALFTQNDTTRLTVDGCTFQENNTTGTGGAVYVNTNIAARITNSTFSQNIGSTGGALHANGDSLLTISGCYFLDNIATTQGAGVNLNHADAVLTNCLFAKNVNTNGTGAGGAISNNASADLVSKLKAVNCTFADNVASIGAGIAQWEDLTGNSETYLLNCLFQNPDGENYTIEEGTPAVFSLNGNQSSDATLKTDLTQSKDLHNTFNTFINPDGNDYKPLINAPAADGGVTAGAPNTDITGALRTGTPDVGCFEVKTTGTQNPGIQSLPLQCAPNPAIDHTVISFQHDRNGRVEITLWNQAGQVVAQYNAEKTGAAFAYTLPVGMLPAGAYRVQARMGAVVYEGGLVKR